MVLANTLVSVRRPEEQRVKMAIRGFIEAETIDHSLEGKESVRTGE
jgi:hypothetical protein